MIKKYSSAPLPFQGQKRNYLKHINTVLNKYNDSNIFVDLFGGSGLISNNIKAKYPKAEVIYNDYDNYRSRLKNINNTNKLLAKIGVILAPIKYKKIVPEQLKKKVLTLIKNEEKTKKVDYLTLSPSLLFSMKYVKNYEELSKQTFYNRVIKKDYTDKDYLTGIKVVKNDYKTLFNKYKNNKKAVFILDPPYLSTDIKSYNNLYWGLSNYLDILKLTKNNKFLYFTSDRSELLEVINWITKNTTTNFLKNYKKIEIKMQTNTTSYKDLLLYN